MDISNFSSHEAEKALIGAMFLEPKKTLAVMNTVGCSPEWFANDDYRMIYDAIILTIINGGKVDPVLVTEQMPIERRNMLGTSISIMIAGCCDACTTAAHALYYAKILKEKYELRRIHRTLSEGMELLSESKPPAQMVSEIRHKLAMIPAKKNEILTMENIVDVARRSAAEAASRGYSGVPTRLHRLQKAFNGWTKGKMSLLAARPSVGKTTFMSNEASYNALHGRSVAVASMEMTGEEWMTNAICAEAGLNSTKFRYGTFTQAEMDLFQATADKFKKAPLFINDQTHSIGSLCSFIRDMATDKGAELIIFDYLQMISASGSHRSRQEEVASWSNQISNTAKELPGTAVVGISQLSRATMTDKASEPELHHLRDSGSLEQDAYMVAFLFPAQEGNNESDVVPMTFKVAKNRGAPTGRYGIVFKKDIGRFEE